MKMKTQEKRQQSGLRIIFRKGVHADVRKATVKFASWLRNKFCFPVRLTVCMCPEEWIQSRSGEDVVSMLFIPDDKKFYPDIRAATGDYGVLKKIRGDKSDALCAIIYEIALHVINYQSWWFKHNWSKATVRRRCHALMREYATEVKFII